MKKRSTEIIFLAFLIFNITTICSCGTLDTMQQIENNLLKIILKDYDQYVRPAQTVKCKFYFFPRQILTIDEKNNLMTSTIYFTQYWNDSRLEWNTTEYNVTNVLIPIKKLWTPDIVILNSADSDGFLKASDSLLALVHSTGLVAVVYSAASLKTRCEIDVYKFPFDVQVCSINLSPWSHSTFNLDLDVDTDPSDYDSVHPNALWDLKSIDVNILDVGEKFLQVINEGHTAEVVKLVFTIKRKPLFFMINGIFPCFVLNLITLLSYFLAYAPQITISITTFLTFSVYSLRVASDIPVQSDYVPIISLYFIFSILFTLVSLIWFIFCYYLQSKNIMPDWLHYFSNLLRTTLFCSICKKIKIKVKNFKKVNIEKKVDLNNGYISEDLDFKNNLKLDENTQKSKESNEFPQIILCVKCQAKVTGNQNSSTNKNYLVPNGQECTKCFSCEKCNEKSKKDDEKKKRKENVESCYETLNNFIFLVVLLSMAIVYSTIWGIISN